MYSVHVLSKIFSHSGTALDTTGFHHAVKDGFVFDIPEDASSITDLEKAQEYCESKEGGMLASIDTEAKLQAVKDAAALGPVDQPLLFG